MKIAWPSCGTANPLTGLPQASISIPDYAHDGDGPDSPPVVVIDQLLVDRYSRFLESQLYGVGTRDLTVFGAAGSLVLLASVVACYLPARGSTRVDPMVALRDS